MRFAEQIEKHIREQTKLEMDETTFALLNTILEDGFCAHLMVTRASVGAKIVAVIKGGSSD